MGPLSKAKDLALRAKARVQPGLVRAKARFENTHGRLAWLDGLNIEFTSVCNLRCKWCSLDFANNRGMMEIDLLRKVLAEISDPSRFRIRAIDLHNSGEALLHPKFPEFLAEIGKARRGTPAFRTVNLLTNATKLAGEKAEAIFTSGAVDWVRFSMDGGTKETFEEIRRRANYEQVLGNIEAFLDENDRRGRPLRTGLISVFDTDEPVMDERFRAITRRVTNFMPRRPHNWDGSADLGLADRRPKAPPTGPCRFVMVQAVVLWNGKVSPCCADLNGRGPIGDLATESLYDIVRGDARRRMWDLMRKGRRRDIPLCSGCDLE